MTQTAAKALGLQSHMALHTKRYAGPALKQIVWLMLVLHADTLCHQAAAVLAYGGLQSVKW